MKILEQHLSSFYRWGLLSLPLYGESPSSFLPDSWIFVMWPQALVGQAGMERDL
jgi:hypothetical protein